MFELNNVYLLTFNCLKDSLFCYLLIEKIHRGYCHKIKLSLTVSLINISEIACFYLFICLIYMIFIAVILFSQKMRNGKL